MNAIARLGMVGAIGTLGVQVHETGLWLSFGEYIIGFRNPKSELRSQYLLEPWGERVA